MKGTRKLGHATCKLCVPKALPADMRTDVVELINLKTKPNKRGQGCAKALLASVCNEADQAKRFLLLQVRASGPMGLQDLANLYIRNGFQPIQAEPLLMLRPFAGAYG